MCKILSSKAYYAMQDAAIRCNEELKELRERYNKPLNSQSESIKRNKLLEDEIARLKGIILKWVPDRESNGRFIKK